MKNILLTGSGGFIGNHLKNFFREYNLFTPRSFQLNLLDKKEVEKYIRENEIEFIIHCASCGVRITPDASLDDVAKPNIQMFNNLADSGLPMITVGSGAEYDKSNPLVMVKEEDFGKSVPKDPYGYSKYMISKEIETRDNILNLRLFGIYGAGEDPSRVTSCIVASKIKNEPVVLNQNVKFHFIWIDDFCKIVRHFVEHPTREKFLNVTPNESIEIVELAKCIGVETIVKNPGMNKEYTADNSKLLKELGKFEFTGYQDGMQKLYLEFRK
ncbi:MAG: NAD-dependent epimerase/dehydratase family protein [Candidatus Gastranaerophilaceae bacterium]